MKSFITAMLISAAMIIVSIIYTYHIDSVSKFLISENKKAIENILNEDFEKAAENIQAISTYIETKKITLSATLDHTEIDGIESALAELSQYTDCKNKTDALAKASALNVHLEHLPKNYKLKIENIF